MAKTLETISIIAGLKVHGLSQASTADQANAIVEMKACQIAQTGYIGSGLRATPDQIAWAKTIDAARREREAANRIPGTCKGCNSNPCRCRA